MLKRNDSHIGEVHQDLTIVALSTKSPNGYMKYYWARCSCGNYKRLRYDLIKRKGNCGLCDDFKESEVISASEGLAHGKE